jgi:hypothetical protein
LKINNKQVAPSLINEKFLSDIVNIPENDVRKIHSYIRKQISQRARALEKTGDKDSLNSARREAKARFGDGWRECLYIKTIYTARGNTKSKGQDWCPEEGRDFGYSNKYWN